MALINFTPYMDELLGPEPNPARNDNKLAFQAPCNVIVCAGTNSGKSFFCLNALINEDTRMTYDKIYLCIPTIDERPYLYLKKVLEEKVKNTNDQIKADKSLINPRLYENIDVFEHLPDAAHLKDALDNMDKSKQNVLIIDDMIQNKAVNELIKDFCIKNRKKNCSLIYVGHRYYDIPKMIRAMLNNGYVCLWDIPSVRAMHLYEAEFCDTITPAQLKEMFAKARKQKYHPLVIDCRVDVDPHWKYRIGFNEPIGPDIPPPPKPVVDNTKVLKTLPKKPKV